MKSSLTSLLCILFGLTACSVETKTVNSCGDGFIDLNEECDLTELSTNSCSSLGFYSQTGNLTCTEHCKLDLSVCTGRCGDGELQSPAEECEGNNFNGNTCAALGFAGGLLRCSETCTYDTRDCQAGCGNGVIEVGEACDDRNMNSGDGCSSTCTVEEGWSCTGTPSACQTTCGDGIAVGLELCDRDDLNGETCASQGRRGGVLRCTSGCAFDYALCHGTCGDGVLQSDYEECDGAQNPATCRTLGYWTGTIGCNNDCTRDVDTCNGLVQISSNAFSVCGLDKHGGAWCWGRNSEGQLGDGGDSSSNRPVRVAMPVGVTFTKLTQGGRHVCGLTASGQAYCWGLNGTGELGYGNLNWDRKFTPYPVTQIGISFLHLSAGYTHNCGLDSNQAAWCWGAGFNGRLGNGTGDNRASPTIVSMGGKTFYSILSGGGHTCALDGLSRAWCWGWNEHGQCGSVGSSQYLTPTAVTMPEGGVTFSKLSNTATNAHTCAIDNDGDAWCWGYNLNGELGNGYNTSQSVPQPVGGGWRYQEICAGANHSCAIRIGTGIVHCWGKNTYGELGDGTTSTSNWVREVVMPNGISFSNITCGENHTCAIDQLGAPWCWGWNENGRLGDGTSINRHVPTRVEQPL